MEHLGCCAEEQLGRDGEKLERGQGVPERWKGRSWAGAGWPGGGEGCSVQAVPAWRALTDRTGLIFPLQCNPTKGNCQMSKVHSLGPSLLRGAEALSLREVRGDWAGTFVGFNCTALAGAGSVPL